MSYSPCIAAFLYFPPREFFERKSIPPGFVSALDPTHNTAERGDITLARRKKTELEEEMRDLRNRKPPTTPQEQENLLIDLAQKRAEQQLIDGTASSQVITHYLKLGASRERLEQEKIRRETELLATKKESIMSAEAMEDKITAALEMFAVYSGRRVDE